MFAFLWVHPVTVCFLTINTTHCGLSSPVAMLRSHSSGITTTSSTFLFVSSLILTSTFKKGQPGRICIYLFKPNLTFCRWNLNLFEIKSPGNKNILINVGHVLESQCICLEKYTNHGQIPLSVWKEPMCKSYETGLSSLHALTCFEIKNFLLTAIQIFLIPHVLEFEECLLLRDVI